MESSQDSVVDRLDELDAETAAFYREQYDDDGLAADVAGAAAKGTWVAGKLATKAALKTTVFTGKALGKVAKLALVLALAAGAQGQPRREAVDGTLAQGNLEQGHMRQQSSKKGSRIGNTRWQKQQQGSRVGIMKEPKQPKVSRIGKRKQQITSSVSSSELSITGFFSSAYLTYNVSV